MSLFVSSQTQDEFTGNSLDSSRWLVQSGNVSVDNSSLKIVSNTSTVEIEQVESISHPCKITFSLTILEPIDQPFFIGAMNDENNQFGFIVYENYISLYSKSSGFVSSIKVSDTLKVGQYYSLSCQVDYNGVNGFISESNSLFSSPHTLTRRIPSPTLEYKTFIKVPVSSNHIVFESINIIEFQYAVSVGSGGGTGGGSGDASSANQQLEIANLEEVNIKLGELNEPFAEHVANERGILGWLKGIFAKESLIVEFVSGINNSIGSQNDSAATSDTGIFPFLRLFKRLLSVKLDRNLSQIETAISSRSSAANQLTQIDHATTLNADIAAVKATVGSPADNSNVFAGVTTSLSANLKGALSLLADVNARLFNQFRKSEDIELLLQDEITKSNTTLSASGILTIPFSRSKHFTVAYQVSNYISPVAVQVEGEINGMIFNLSPTQTSTIIAGNGVYSFNGGGESYQLDSLRFNFISGNATINVQVAHR